MALSEKTSMDAAEQKNRIAEFLEKEYYGEIHERARTGLHFLVIDFARLMKFDPLLADSLIEQPEETIKAAEIALRDFDIGEAAKKFRIRFRNLPKSQKIMVRNIRSKHIGSIFSIEGVVRQKSDVRPQVTSARFECPSCGSIINVLQLDEKFKEPSRCGCGRKGKFRLLSKELVDAQGIVLEEAPEDLEGGEQPKRMNILLQEDLVSPMTEKKTNPGSKVCVVGFVKEMPIILRTGMQSTRFDLLIEANHIEPMQQDYSDLVITPEEEREIKELASDPKIYKKLADSIAPSIYGYDKIKEALVLQLVSGVRKKRDDGTVSRGDMHILLIGDPGSGKSALLKRVTIVAPKARYISGKGISGAGLTASVVKDEFLKGWALEAGALVLANKGSCMIDEMDKMSPEDRAAMHEALEQQTVTISKANIQATLRAETTVLAAANPKFGRFDPYETIAKQIDLPPTLINRFDLIFAIRDLPNKENDEKMARFILSLHQDPNFQEPEIPTPLIRKFIAYAKRLEPQLTDAALDEIRGYYMKMRASGSEEGEIKSVPISARQLEALVRLSEAAAKVRLSKKVQKKDAQRAIELVHYCLAQIGVDPETGKIDIDRITTGITATERSKIVTIREIITDLENKLGKTIPIEDIIAYAKEKGLDESKVEEAIEKLKRSGDVFEPKRGFIQKI